MRTLADIRRRMVPGARLEVTKHTRFPEQVGSVRTVHKNQTKDIAWRTPGAIGYKVSWSPWPKAAHVRITDADSYEYDLVDERDDSVHGTVGLRFLPSEDAG